MADKKIFLGGGPQDPDLKRSTYDYSFTNHMTAKFGLIYPCYLQEINPDESVTIRPRAEFDLMPMVFPLQSKITMHISFFRCAFRNVWDGYKDHVSRVGNHRMPFISRQNMWHPTGSLADYMGIPSHNVKVIDGFKSVSVMYDKDPLINMMSRCFFTYSESTFDRYAPVHYTTKDGEDVVLLRGFDMGDFYSSLDSSVDSSALNAQISDVVRDELSDICFIKFSILSLSSSPSKAPSIIPAILAKANKPSRINGNNVDLLEWHEEVYEGSTTQTSLVDVDEGTYGFLGSRQVTLQGYGNVYEWTFGIHVKSTFVDVFNSLFVDGYSMQLVLMWYNNSDSVSFFGTNEIPHQRPDSLVSPNTIFAQNFSIVQDHLALTSSNYHVKYEGLQGTIFVKCKSGTTLSANTSPFVKVGALDPLIPINALPFRVYEFIYNLYFRNSQVDPFILNGQPTYNEYLTNRGDGADSTTPVDFKHALYESDFFTTSKFTPQMGNAPLVGISHTPGASQAVFHFIDDNDQPVNLRVATNSNGILTGIDEYGTNANESTIKNLNALITYGISINDFRSVSAFQRFLERNQRAGFDYKSVIKEFFGTNAPIGEEFPEYLGGISQPVNIYKIENQSQASAKNYPLGYFAGTGRVAASFNKGERPIKCYTSERSYIMGLVWFSVTPVYSQVLPKHWTKSHLLDYFNPAFATIGNQPIHNYELAPLQAQSTDELMGVFGYQRPWYEYTMHMDEAHGQFRDSQHNYLLQREFLDIPQLGHDFISIENDDLTDVFSYTEGSDKIFGAIRFDVNYKSIVPKFIQPSIIG